MNGLKTFLIAIILSIIICVSLAIILCCSNEIITNIAYGLLSSALVSLFIDLISNRMEEKRKKEQLEYYKEHVRNDWKRFEEFAINYNQSYIEKSFDFVQVLTYIIKEKDYHMEICLERLQTFRRDIWDFKYYNDENGGKMYKKDNLKGELESIIAYTDRLIEKIMYRRKTGDQRGIEPFVEDFFNTLEKVKWLEQHEGDSEEN